jgi:hypothetical protein
MLAAMDYYNRMPEPPLSPPDPVGVCAYCGSETIWGDFFTADDATPEEIASWECWDESHDKASGDFFLCHRHS